MGDPPGFSGAKHFQTLSRLTALAAVNCLKAQHCFEEPSLCLVHGDGGLSQAA